MKSDITLLVLLALFALAGCSGEKPSDGESTDGEQVAKIEDDEPLRSLEPPALPTLSTRPLNVYTEKPGFAVFVNGYPARTFEGELLKTPCDVGIPQAAHEKIQITVAKEGLEDLMEPVTDSERAELVFGSPQPANELTKSLLSSPLLDAEIGRPVSLFSLNSAGRELDPYLEPGGLVIWFVGEREEGRGIYRAERESRYDFFSAPQILRTTQSGELAASPSVTSAGKLVYAIPEKTRILAVSTNPMGEDRPEILMQGNRTNVLWESALISRDGRTLNWTERPIGSQDRRGLTAFRPASAAGFSESQELNLPGSFPCLSGDGLRQYQFDGQILERSRRNSPYARFSVPEILVNFDRPLAKPDSDRRWFWVTDDEEWLFYAQAGELYAVRLSMGPGWGYAPIGKPIPPRVTIAERKPQDPGSLPFIPMPVPEKPMETGPPYPKFRADFVELLKHRKYEDADAALAQAMKDPRFKADQEVLAWDAEELRSVKDFWTSLREHLKTVPAGTEFSIRMAKVKFVKFADDVIHYRLSKDGTKPLTEMQPRDMLALLAPVVGEDPKVAMQAGLFLFFDEEGSEKLAEQHLANAGEAAKLFQERLAGRVLHNARRELDEGEIPQGLAYLEELLKAYPDSSSAEAAKSLLAEFYKQVKWEPAGQRKWEEPEAGVYQADKSRQANSYLVSPKSYSHFELRMEWKITEPGGSGGVFFRYAAPGREDPYRKAFKVQLADDRGFKPDPQTTGALHTYEAPSENRAKPSGEWNTLRLRVKNLKVEVWINGGKVLDTVAQSNLVPLKGFVALDGVTGGIAYRKTLLLELSPEVE